MMEEKRLDAVFQRSQQAYELYDVGRLEDAKRLSLEIEAEATTFSDAFDKAACLQFAASCLVDIGGAVNDENIVRRGLGYYREWLEKYGSDQDKAHSLYNVANSYLTLWQFHSKEYIANGIDNEDHRLARHYYRLSAEELRFSGHQEVNLLCQVWTNYGNALSHSRRSVEAIDAYDQAIKYDPNMGLALGNKGVAISYLAVLMHGHAHLYFLESIRLLQAALRQPLMPDARASFEQALEKVRGIVNEHGTIGPEELHGIEPVTNFHRFLCEFSAEHGLFLNPASFLGTEGRAFYGDPMFISTMYAPVNNKSKFERYFTFLNEIKEDYVLARYFLAQSLYSSADLDAVDSGVTMFYPLDYSLYGTYIQLLKAANKQAIAVLEKIAFFIYDYCGLSTKLTPNQVYFRQIWGGNEKMRRDLAAYSSPHLFGLFSLARDVANKGDWSRIYEHRDALTHRFLILHERKVGNQANPDLPRDDHFAFIRDTILALKIARAAVMYLILFVDEQESSKGSGARGHIIRFPSVEQAGRYRPYHIYAREGHSPGADSQ